jgi:hypothetical protein
MTKRLQFTCLWVLFVMNGVEGVAQTTSVASGTRIADGQVWLSTGGSVSAALVYATGSSLQTVTGRPYSAEEIVEHVQTMADGTDKRQTFQKATLYRDLEGRTRTETTITLKRGTADPSLSSFVEIIDPVAGYRYMLDPQKETASRSLWPPTRQQADGVGSTATSSSVSGNEQTADKAPVSRVSTNYSFTTAPETTHQSLGTQMIEGITTEGALTTTTYPSGFMGSEMPVTATWEH